MHHTTRQLLALNIVMAFITIPDFRSQLPGQSNLPPQDEPNGFTISQQTTYLKGPLRPDGIPDYAAAIDTKMRQGIKPQDNACIPLYQAIGPSPDGYGLDYPTSFFKRLQMQRPPRNGKYVAELATTLNGLSDEKISSVFAQMEQATQRPWRHDEFPEIAHWLERNKTPLVKIHQAVQRDQYFLPLLLTIGKEDPKDSFSLGGALLPGVYLCNDITRQLCTRSMLHLGEHNPQAAWKDLWASLKLARLVGKGPTTDEALTAYNMENQVHDTLLTLIQQARSKPQEIDLYRRSLNRLPPLARAKDKLELTGRCACLEAIMILSKGHKNASKLFDFTPELGRLANIIQLFDAQISLDWDVSLRVANAWYDRVKEALEIPTFPQRQKSIQQIRNELSSYKAPSGEFLKKINSKKEQGKLAAEMIGNIVVVLILPEQIHTCLAQEVTRQKGRNLELAMALADFYSEHADYPDKLNKLVPKYLERIPADLFSGKAPVYRRFENGYLLYSVGPNGRDEGGRTHQSQTLGDDLTVQMGDTPR